MKQKDRFEPCIMKRKMTLSDGYVREEKGLSVEAFYSWCTQLYTRLYTFYHRLQKCEHGVCDVTRRLVRVKMKPKVGETSLDN